MGTDIHAFVEFDVTGVPPFSGLVWRKVENGRTLTGIIEAFAAGEFYITRDYRLFAALAGVRSNVPPRYAPQGLPEFLSDAVVEHYYHMVADPEDVDVFAGMRYVSRQEADEWVQHRSAHYRDSLEKARGLVSDPDAHTASSLTLPELQEALAHMDVPVSSLAADFQVIIEMMTALENHIGSSRTRLVFWFDN